MQQLLDHRGRPSLQCRRILGGRNLVRVRNIVVAAIFDFMTVKTPALQAKGDRVIIF